MPFPQYPKDYQQEVIITPKQHFLAEQEEYQAFEAPRFVILCFETWLMDHFKQLKSTTYRPFWTGEMAYLDSSKEVAIVGNFGIRWTGCYTHAGNIDCCCSRSLKFSIGSCQKRQSHKSPNGGVEKFN
ncbi:MAG: hypothetical protein AAGJ93_11400 [Bacteroidota bacterium]